MRRHLVTPFASIKFRASLGVYGESFVGVNSYTEEARVGLKIYEIEQVVKRENFVKKKNTKRLFLFSSLIRKGKKRRVEWKSSFRDASVFHHHRHRFFDDTGH